MTDRAGRLRGITLMIAAVGVFGVMDGLMKLLAARYPPMQIACLRGASSLPFVFATCIVTGRLRDLRPRRLHLHAMRNFPAMGERLAARGSTDEAQVNSANPPREKSSEKKPAARAKK